MSRSIRHHRRGLCGPVALLLPCVLSFALMRGAAAQVPTTPPPDTAARLPDFGVTAKPVHTTRIIDTNRVTPLQKLTLPVTASITANKVQETVNIMDTEDALKNLPSIFLRKRNYGDNQATIETRMWGVGSSARTLVFADDVPLSSLVANNNNIGAPRWGMVSPEEITRVDLMLGPFSAAYAGNSMGGVTAITTRMPTQLEGGISQTVAAQAFSLYGTDATYGTYQTAAHLGDRIGKLAFWLSGNYTNSHSQPLSYVTSSTFPAGTVGGYAAQNKLGATANVLGASGLLATGMGNARLKVAYDLTSALRATYTFGFWQNSSTSTATTFLQDSTGQPTYAGASGFATGANSLLEQHFAQSLALRTDSHKDWDFEVVGTNYDFNTDRQRSPLTASTTGTTVGQAGRVALLDGTGWSTFDAKAAWHRGGVLAHHVVTFGVHADQYTLNNPTYNVPDWTVGDASTATSVATEGDGKTRTLAAWAQDAWRMAPALTLTFGARYEGWRAYDGYNANGTTTVTQPVVTHTGLSPKGALAWTASPGFTVTASIGKAYRFATASELYQLVSTGTTYTAPDPNLKPDDDLSTELRFDRRLGDGHVQLSLFQDDVHDAIISQYLPLVAGSSTLYSVVANVDHVRGRGAELVIDHNNVAIAGLELSGSVTYVDARTLAISGQASATAPAGSAIGKRLPQIPDWRANAMATYRPDYRWAFTLAARYSGKLYTTLDDADVNPNTWQGFSKWFVMDAKVNFRINRHLDASLGVDNLNNDKYFFYHPFPERTVTGGLSYGF
ncbi:MAG TPA: TonB-dependent receptor [Gemmatimonadales bacterium]|jgi:iron complex outermembrane receptor protein